MARKRLLRAAAARHAQAEAERREHWLPVTASGQALDDSTLTIDPEQLNTPSARTSRLVANVAHTLVVRGANAPLCTSTGQRKCASKSSARMCRRISKCWSVIVQRLCGVNTDAQSRCQ